MGIVNCPQNLNQFISGAPIFENTFPEEECKQKRFYGDCFHCFATSIAKRDKQLKQKAQSDYETRLKADMVAMLTDLSMKIGEIEDGYTEFDEESKRSLTMIPLESVERLIDKEINSLKGDKNGSMGSL